MIREIEALDTLLVSTAPRALVMHIDGLPIGYVLVIADKVTAVRYDGMEVIQSSWDHFQKFWLEIMGAQLARPVEPWQQQ